MGFTMPRPVLRESQSPWRNCGVEDVERGERAVRGAIQNYIGLLDSELGSSWVVAAARVLEHRLGKGYVVALCKLHTQSRNLFTTTPKEVLEAEIAALVQAENAEENPKEFLSGAFYLDKLRIRPKFVQQGEWQVIK